MPLTQSAIKRAKQNLVRQERLRPYKTRMKTILRKVTDAVKAGNKEEAAKMLPEAQKYIDIAVKKGFLHANNAARKKSSLARMISAEAKPAQQAKPVRKAAAKK